VADSGLGVFRELAISRIGQRRWEEVGGGGRRWEEVGGTRCGLDVPVEFPLGEEFPNLDP
jgi:hypothetical protein